eukprot:TRINITY_DN8272_c0_g4_i3.p1 TRINITY_DN8272_c0_g4~~TRINITY_DN8272_c0_g4_i3.p1  ORF type:complete len:280 (-),score=46.12 TRINITY_DN8272_c0_g4_i3:14-853(-)
MRNRVRDFGEKKQMQKLPIAQIEQKLAKSLATVPWAYSSDGCLHYGSGFILHNKKTNGSLVADIATRLPSVEELYAVATTKKPMGPTARSIFIIQKADPKQKTSTDPICFGDEVRIHTNPHLFPKPVTSLTIVALPEEQLQDGVGVLANKPPPGVLFVSEGDCGHGVAHRPLRPDRAAGCARRDHSPAGPRGHRALRHLRVPGRRHTGLPQQFWNCVRSICAQLFNLQQKSATEACEKRQKEAGGADEVPGRPEHLLSLIHICRCRRYAVCRSRWSPYH